MSFIPKPSNISVNNSVSASDIRFIYESLTSGLYDIAVSSLDCQNLILNNLNLSGLSCTFFSPIFIGQSIQTFSNDPIDRINNNVDSLMLQYGLSASEENVGKIASIEWNYGIRPNPTYKCNLLTACLKNNENSYIWIFNEKFYNSWNITNVIN